MNMNDDQQHTPALRPISKTNCRCPVKGPGSQNYWIHPVRQGQPSADRIWLYFCDVAFLRPPRVFLLIRISCPAFWRRVLKGKIERWEEERIIAPVLPPTRRGPPGTALFTVGKEHADGSWLPDLRSDSLPRSSMMRLCHLS
jgi:hypothetical protein